MEKFIHLGRQILSFGWIGTLGFTVDALTFLAANAVVENAYGARVISYFVASTFTWAMNRHFTFGASDKSMWREWLSFLTIQSAGGFVNYGVFALLIATMAIFAANPVAAIAVGSITAMGVNFTTAKFLIFEARSKDETPTL